jgi:hypothetical protein
MVFDGWTIVVELRDGLHYRTYRYNSPDVHPAWPEAAQVQAVARTLRAIDSLEATPDVQRVYRGVTTGRYQSGFRSCDGGGEWEFHADLASLITHAPPGVRARLAPADTARTAGDSTRYVVEVTGTLTPEWLARRWESRFPRVLQVDQLRSVRPTGASECRAGPR